MPRPEHIVTLGQFAGEFELTPDQVTDELASGRLAFDVNAQGQVVTDTFAVLDWIQRRINAISLFGIDKVGFPVYAVDWRAVENIPDRCPTDPTEIEA